MHFWQRNKGLLMARKKHKQNKTKHTHNTRLTQWFCPHAVLIMCWAVRESYAVMPLSFQPGHQKTQLLYHMAQNPVLDTLCFTTNASQKWGRCDNWEVSRWKGISLKQPYFFRLEAQPHCTCTVRNMYRMRNDLLSLQLHQTISMHPPSEETGLLTLTQACDHEPFPFSTVAPLQALCIKEQLQNSMAVGHRGTLQINF